MKHALTLTALLAIVALCSVPVVGETLEPLTVSPGATDRLTGVEVRCPTFSWQVVPGAVGYEVVVYALPSEVDLAAWNLDDAVEVLFVELPAGVTGWTPSLESGLARGADHVWFVRGVLIDAGLDEVGATEWSVARFFRVAGSLSQPGIGNLSGEAREASGTGTDADADAGGAVSRGTKAEADRNVMAKRVGEKNTKDVGTALAAIRGEIPDATGETYGVVGSSNSPDGAGLGAVNTAGGPDLVLDGSEDGVADLLVWQSGVERASSLIESFFFNNPDVGEIDVHVEGWVFSQSFVGGGDQLTGVDAETLDGIDSTGFSPFTHLHDDRYFTESELSTSWGGGTVHWDNLAAVPFGLDDGDDDTTYTVGPGLIIDGDTIVIDPSAFVTRISILDSVGQVGSHTSIAISGDGLGLISYYDQTNQDLKVAHCADAACTSASTVTLDSGGITGLHTSIAIDADGLGLISYYDQTNDDLKVAHCADVACTTATISTVDSVGEVGRDTSIAIGADGLGLISYYEQTTSALKVAHCDDASCTSATSAVLDSGGIVGEHSSIAIGSDGLGLISYLFGSGIDLRVAHCGDVVCTSATAYTIDSITAGTSSSIAIGTDGLGLISYSGDSALKVAHCVDLACSSVTTSTLDSDGGLYTSMAIGDDGLGLISYYDTSNTSLKVARCIDAACTSSSSTTVESWGIVGYDTSIVIGNDGLGLISYYALTKGDLKVAHLGIGTP